MRQIKYRGLRKDNGEFAYGYYLKKTFHNKLGDTPQLVYEKHFINCFDDLNLFNSIFEQVEVDPETVGEYTGLKDKNREDIYENDILKIINPWDELEWTTKVRYESGVFCVDVEGYDYNVTPLGYIDEEFIIEKIGNSYTRTF